MANFLDLPIEIGIQIVDDIGDSFPSTLASFALASRFCHHLCQHILPIYQRCGHLRMTEESRTTDITFLKLFADLLTNAGSRRYVLRVTLNDRDWEDFGGYDDNFFIDYSQGVEGLKSFCCDKLEECETVLGTVRNACQALIARRYEFSHIIAIGLQSLPNLEKLTLSGSSLVKILDKWIPRRLTDVYNRHFCSTSAYSNLTHVEIRGRSSIVPRVEDNRFCAPDLALLMGLPALRSLSASEIFTIGPYDSRYGHADSRVSYAKTSVNLHKYTAPLEELVFQSCCVCFEDIETTLGTARPRSLRVFHLHASIDGGDFLSIESLYDPRACIRIIQQQAHDSLESFSMSVEDNYLAYTLRNEHSMPNFEISNYALTARDSLRKFQRLKEIKVEAHLLLNGYGLIERLQQYALKCSVVGIKEFVTPRFKGLLTNNEQYPKDEPLPLSLLLPQSLERLEISCTDFQRPLMIKKLHDAIGNVKPGAHPKGFPCLKLVQLRRAASGGEGNGKDGEEPPYCSYQEVADGNET